MILRKIGIVSCAKLMGLLYAAVGLFFGLVFTFISLVGATFGALTGDSGAGPLAVVFGIGAVIIIPVCYGVMGLIGGFVMAGLYNIAAHFVGGVEFEFDQTGGPAQS